MRDNIIFTEERFEAFGAVPCINRIVNESYFRTLRMVGLYRNTLC